LARQDLFHGEKYLVIVGTCLVGLVVSWLLAVDRAHPQLAEEE
jgi:hypothetical protein